MHKLTSSLLAALAKSEQAACLSVDARKRLEWISYFVTHKKSVTDTCSDLGISRSTFHRWLERFDPNDLTSLEEKSHEPHRVRTSAIGEDIVALIRTYRENQPLIGKEQIRILLQKDHNITASSSTIERLIEQHCLYFADTPLHWKKRATAEEKKYETTETEAASPAPVFETPIEQETLVEKILVPEKSHAPHRLLLVNIITNIAIAALFVAAMVWQGHTTQKLAAELTEHQTPATAITSSIEHP